MDISWLIQWKAEKENELDALGVKPTQKQEKKKKAEFQSDTPGVLWDCKRNKWVGTIYDRLEKKYIHPSPCMFETEAECVSAVLRLRDTENDQYNRQIMERKASNPTLNGLEKAPVCAQDAQRGIVYWHVDGRSNHVPYRVVVSKSQTGYHRACHECNQFAIRNISENIATHCTKHGGGSSKLCQHGSHRTSCRDCNPNAKNLVNNCSVCAVSLDIKRRTTKGGNGICNRCEQHLASEAAASGSAPPEKGKRWEDHVLDKLIPKVVDSTTGVPFAFEMRDDMRHMLGSKKEDRRQSVVEQPGSKRQRRSDSSSTERESKREDCDTTKQRRPDLLYLVREPERGRIVAALKVGVDEHSHDGYDPECESGKIDDQFQALQQLAAKEGAATGAVARFDAQMIYCTFLKFNPIACDVTPAIKLDDRIEVLAKRCSDFLNTPAEEFQKRSAEGEANVPHVECLFYHSKQGKPILDHFNAKADGAWDWRGNSFA